MYTTKNMEKQHQKQPTTVGIKSN